MNLFPHQYATTRRFTLGVPRNLAITADGAAVLFLRSEGPLDPVLCLWEIDTVTGAERKLVDPKQSLTGSLDSSDSPIPAAELARRERARESAGGIVAYTTDDSDRLVVFALAGDLYVFDRSSGVLRALATPGPVYDPVIDPSGRRVAFVSSGEHTGLWTVGVDSDEPAMLVIGDDEPTVSWGVAEFVAAEEMSRTRGMWWSPDGDRLLAERVDERDVPVWWIGDPAHPEREPRSIRYPAAGAANAAVGLALFSLDPAVGPTMIDWSDGGRFEYLANVIWADGHRPLVVRQSRDQRTVEIVALDIDAARPAEPTVGLQVVHTIQDDTWVELLPGSPTPSDAGLLTIEDSATDRRLHLDGRPITPDGLQVRSIISADAEWVHVTASEADPTAVHVFSVPLTGGEPVARTVQPGVHGLIVRGEVSVSSTTRPERSGTEVELRFADRSHRIEDRSASPVLEARPHFFRAGSRGLHCALFLPDGHDPEQELPVLLDPYGGPHAQRVLQTHNAHLVSQWFAEQGYAVLVTDGRGTPGRGPAFERAVWGDLAQPVLDDQIDALDAAASQFGGLDLGRVGIRGWSFGGYLAALALLRRPDRIHAAIAGAPVTSWRLYDTHYTERYLGRPDEYPEHYARSDLAVDPDGRSRPLLLIHGLADDNVVAAHTLRLSSAMLAAGRAHHVLPLSGVTHMTPQEVVAENLLWLQLHFLDSHLASAQG
jgi:dipeptidyl-peptidase-4